MSLTKNKIFSAFIVIFFMHFTNVNALTLKQTTWQSLPNWNNDHFQETLVTLNHSCSKLKKQKEWVKICHQANQLNNDNATIRQFYEANFNPFQVLENNSNSGLITGYFEPLLKGSLTKTGIYQYPIYGKPSDLKRDGDKRYKISNNKKVPYATRAQINNSDSLNQHVLLWTDDPHLLYFLHVQGSGKIMLNDGSLRHLQYADNNGYPYVSLGALLIKHQLMKKEDINYYSLLTWMRANPEKADELMNENQRYIFFNMGNDRVVTRGSLNVPLTAERSIAIDPKKIPQGYPLWLDTTLPQRNDAQPLPYQRLMFAQDTGAAIKGAIRADVFFGSGDDAEFYAGNMKQSGQLYLLKPKN